MNYQPKSNTSHSLWWITNVICIENWSKDYATWSWSVLPPYDRLSFFSHWLISNFFPKSSNFGFLGIKPEINLFLKRTYWLSLCCIDWLTVEAQSLLVFLLWLRRSSSFIITFLTNDLLSIQRRIYNLWIYVITEDGHKDFIYTVKLNYC